MEKTNIKYSEASEHEAMIGFASSEKGFRLNALDGLL